MTPDLIAIVSTQTLTQTVAKGATATTVIVSPDQVGTALTDALNQGGSQWMVSTLVAFLPALWTMALILHLGRPYVLRSLRRMGLRLGADIWWMSYLLIRDGVLLITFALSFIFFSPNLAASMPFPITAPLATLLLFLALVVKLTRRADDDIAAYRLTTAFLVAGATLYYGALVFAVEAASQDYLAGFAQAFTSNTNVPVALGILWVSLLGVTLAAGWLFIRALNSAARTMERTNALPSQRPPLKTPAA